MADQILSQPLSIKKERIKTLSKLPSLVAQLLHVSQVVIRLEHMEQLFCYSLDHETADVSILTNELEAAQQGYSFYFSSLINTGIGGNVGSIHIIDREARILNDKEIKLLNDVIDIIIDQIELEFESKKILEKHHQVLNTTAHDLKNPLTTIPVRADLIKLKKHDPEIVEKMCDHIKVASLNMIRIIDELLQSGTAEEGKVSLLLMKLNISGIVGNVIAMNQPLAERKNQVINLNNATMVMVKADEGKMAEIIDNLVNNAIKYSPVNSTINVDVRVADNKVVVVVEDEGQGLTDDDKSKLYQRFTKLSAKPTGDENSTGLGLSIVKILIEAHGGRIWAESEGAGKGSRFIIELPVCV
ncbi:HAMP domain-containing sensor histidine kinase [Pedobacter frigoris]|uniref:sensor histidine kinase n=1 Tax=Pedobacter frigoris TaxID=2571272 RepID=UPI0029302DD9|nr:HAMP domain-containing sensor histidine kinase [Pedobacter frigoris]